MTISSEGNAYLQVSPFTISGFCKSTYKKILIINIIVEYLSILHSVYVEY